MISASAPGKVLICGGYLVVEAPNIGLSIGVSARFTTNVLLKKSNKDDDANNNNQNALHVVVKSPQFKTEFEFLASVESENAEVSVKQLSGPSSPFLFYGVLYATACGVMHNATLPARLELELLASNDFYSQRNYLEQQGKHVTASTLRTVPDHNPIVGAVSKTGLGSSAAMTTSFVACLLRALGVPMNDVEQTHRVAQVAHSVAQGKIGSGFDVFTATYGTSIYRRFPAACAEMMMTGSEPPKQVAVELLKDCIKPSKVWVESIPFHGLPRGLHLILGDIHQGGSSTPGMVAKVMAWRKSIKGNPDNLWDMLAKANVRFIELLQKLCAMASENNTEYDAAVHRLSQESLNSVTSVNSSEEVWLEAFHGARTCRQLLRQVGHAAEVSIEPPELTTLLDDTANAIPGVFAVGCPGAGGYDAVFALVLGEDGCKKVEAYWETYENMEVCPLLVREDSQGGLVCS